jgi:hypothetical protein
MGTNTRFCHALRGGGGLGMGSGGVAALMRVQSISMNVNSSPGFIREFIGTPCCRYRVQLKAIPANFLGKSHINSNYKALTGHACAALNLRLLSGNPSDCVEVLSHGAMEGGGGNRRRG